jgi:hypothetical protein
MQAHSTQKLRARDTDTGFPISVRGGGLGLHGGVASRLRARKKGPVQKIWSDYPLSSTLITCRAVHAPGASFDDGPRLHGVPRGPLIFLRDSHTNRTGGKPNYEGLPSHAAARRDNVNTFIAARPTASSIHGARSLSNRSSHFEISDSKCSQRGLVGDIAAHRRALKSIGAVKIRRIGRSEWMWRLAAGAE